MLLWSLALASPLVQALEAELERSSELQIPDAPPIHHLRYLLADVEQHGMFASFGSLVRESNDPFHALGIELRVGKPSYDNTGFGGWENGFIRTSLPRELSPIGLRQSAWLLTDRAYKQAIEQYARKKSQFSPPPDYPGDFHVPAKVVLEGPTVALADNDLSTRAIKLSSVFAENGSDLLLGQVHVGQEAGHVWLVDSEGTRLRRPLAEASMRVFASARTEAGVLLTDSRLYSARTAEMLPSQEKMEAEIIAMRDDLLARRSTERLEEEYVGPMIFEADAALDLQRYLLAPQLEGTPAEVPFDSFFGELGDQKATVRVGRRVLPEGWTAYDDPRTDPDHPSTFTHDWEGVPTERTELVRDGIVNDLLLSLVPRKGLQPNGHARGFVGERANGRVAQLEVAAPKSKPMAALRKKGLKMAASYGHDHVLLVRRLQEPAVLARHKSPGLGGDDRAKLPPPVEVIRLYADGREEIVHGARFAFSDRFLLRDIAMAGPTHTGTFMAPFSGSYTYLGPTEGMPTRITAPSVLVREIELSPIGADPRDTPVLTPP